MSEIQQIQACIVLKTYTDKYWIRLLPDIQILIQSKIIEVLSNAKNLKTEELLFDAVHALLLKDLTNWPNIGIEICELIKATAKNPDKLYFTLLVLLELVKTPKVISDNSHKAEQTILTFFYLLEEIC